MENINNRAELLSPVSSKDGMISAINSGCDAIYFGGKNFNARASANNFTNEEIGELIKYCHLRGVKANLTLNILYKENEIKNVLSFVSEIYSYGIDAIIVQDIGIFNLIKNNFKNVSLHASTQMTIHNIEGAKFLQRLGFDRIVLSRELSLDELKNIISNINIEVEAFIHGALCVSYSGRCFMSSFLGNRSGNRGRCAQPCRMPYDLIKDNKIIKKGYLLSLKDMMSLPIIDELIECGIHTFKIEGRMKSPEYVASVTSNYRKYIDKAIGGSFDIIEDNDINEIAQIFNRGGSSSLGYYKSYSGKNMMSSSPKRSGLKIGIVTDYNHKTKKCLIKLDTELICGDGIEIWTKTKNNVGTNISKIGKKGEIIQIYIDGAIQKNDLVFRSFDKALDNKLKKVYQKETRKREILASVVAKVNSPLSISLYADDICITAYGDTVQSAKNSAVSSENLLKNLSKTGATPFIISFIDNDIDDNIYIPISLINELRRNAINMLENTINEKHTRERIKVSYSPKIDTNDTNYIYTLVNTKEQFIACVQSGVVKRIYLEFDENNIKNIDYFIDIAHEHNIEIYVAFLSILREHSTKDFYVLFDILENSDIDGYLLRNYMDIKTNKKIACDYTFNLFNNEAIKTILSMYDSATLSLELNIDEIKALSSKNSEVLVYGKLPAMTTQQCPVGLYVGDKTENYFCKMRYKSDGFYLKDEKGEAFPVKNDCLSCVSTIFNSKPLYVLNKYREIRKLKNNFRLNFIDEDKNTALNILNNYNNALILKNDNINCSIENNDYTNGHFFKGVL